MYAFIAALGPPFVLLLASGQLLVPAAAASACSLMDWVRRTTRYSFLLPPTSFHSSITPHRTTPTPPRRR